MTLDVFDTCIVCEEHCPTPKKATWFEEVIVPTQGGGNNIVKQPRVNLDLCTGCGISQNKCRIAETSIRNHR